MGMTVTSSSSGSFLVCLFLDRVSVVSLVRGVVLDLRVFRDLVDFLEHLELMDPR